MTSVCLLHSKKGELKNQELQKRKNGGFREGFAWVPDLRSLDKLLEVGVSPYLGFIPSLSTLSIFELNEAVRGRLIGPKSWDRIVINS